jgi:hypothetical protein
MLPFASHPPAFWSKEEKFVSTALHFFQITRASKWKAEYQFTPCSTFRSIFCVSRDKEKHKYKYGGIFNSVAAFAYYYGKTSAVDLRERNWERSNNPTAWYVSFQQRSYLGPRQCSLVWVSVKECVDLPRILWHMSVYQLLCNDRKSFFFILFLANLQSTLHIEQ